MEASGGTIGAMAGLAFGLGEYVLVTRMIGRAIAAEASLGGDLPGADGLARRMRPVKIALLIASFIVMPFVGYLAGNALGPQVAP